MGRFRGRVKGGVFYSPSRTLYGGRSVQFAGYLYDELPIDRVVVLGFLAPAFWPGHVVRFRIPINPGQSTSERSDLVIEDTGQVVLRPLTTMTFAAFRVVYSLN